MKRRLFTPGPVSIYPPALWASLDANIHHRTPEFRAVLTDVMKRLQNIMGEPSELFVFAASGSGGMEAAVSNFFSAGEEVLVASCGKFGERWIELARKFGLNAKVLTFPYGDAVPPEEIASAIKSQPGLRGVFIQACESSTGVQNDVESIAKIVGASDALLVVDAVSALATMPLSFAMGVDVLVAASQKAIMIPPGLAFLGCSQRAWGRVAGNLTPRFYFDLRAAKKAWDENGQTPFTPATSLILGLQQSLQEIENVGLSRMIELTENLARATRAGLKALSLEIFAKRPANALTAVIAPQIGAEKITGELKKRFGIQVAGGQGEMKGRIFRIGHMGFIDHFDTLGLLSALELILDSLGVRIVPGSSLTEFQKIFSEVRS